MTSHDHKTAQPVKFTFSLCVCRAISPAHPSHSHAQSPAKASAAPAAAVSSKAPAKKVTAKKAPAKKLAAAVAAAPGSRCRGCHRCGQRHGQCHPPLTMDAVQAITWPPWRNRWAWLTWLWPCGALPEAQPANPCLGQPRPLCAVQRPRLHADLCGAAPHGLQAAHRRTQNFRQLHSKTAGHPEVGVTRAWKPPPARWARASPMPWAWRWRKAAGRRVQPRGLAIVDHHTYVFMGDGCLMEGISHEAWPGRCLEAQQSWSPCTTTTASPSTAGGALVHGRHRRPLPKPTGWNVIGPVDGARRRCRGAPPSPRPRTSADKPTLIICKTTSAKAARTAPTPPRPRRAAGCRRNQAHPRRPLGWSTRPS